MIKSLGAEKRRAAEISFLLCGTLSYLGGRNLEIHGRVLTKWKPGPRGSFWRGLGIRFGNLFGEHRDAADLPQFPFRARDPIGG